MLPFAGPCVRVWACGYGWALASVVESLCGPISTLSSDPRVRRDVLSHACFLTVSADVCPARDARSFDILQYCQPALACARVCVCVSCKNNKKGPFRRLPRTHAKHAQKYSARKNGGKFQKILLHLRMDNFFPDVALEWTTLHELHKEAEEPTTVSAFSMPSLSNYYCSRLQKLNSDIAKWKHSSVGPVAPAHFVLERRKRLADYNWEKQLKSRSKFWARYSCQRVESAAFTTRRINSKM